MSIRPLIVQATKKLPAPLQRNLRIWVERRRDAVLAKQIKSIASITAWETPICAICGLQATTAHASRNGFKIVCCQNDGLIFVSPRPVNLEPFYDERYYNGKLPGSYADNYISYATENYIPVWNARLEAIEEILKEGNQLLDVGCATGEFLRVARQRGWTVSGIELSAWAVEAAKDLYNLAVIQGGLPDSRLPCGSYDAVTMWDCIEHLSDPRKVLLDIRRLLRPTGVLMLSTGAIVHKDPKLTSKWYYPPWHLYYFAEPTIRELLVACGYDVVSYIEQDEHSPEYTLMVVIARPR